MGKTWHCTPVKRYKTVLANKQPQAYPTVKMKTPSATGIRGAGRVSVTLGKEVETSTSGHNILKCIVVYPHLLF